MNKISNALIIDDKSNLIISDNSDTDKHEYKSLQAIKNYFLKNSIPFSIINNLNSLSETIEQIRNIPKPDLVVLDLDLNSNGDVDEYDIKLLQFLLTEINKNYGEFILLIYSSLADKWKDIRSDVTANDEKLNFLLAEENTIIQRKKPEFDLELKQRISHELTEKTNRYFSLKNLKISDGVKKLWNKEIALFAFFFIALLIIIYESFSGLNFSILLSSVLIIVLIVIRFITPEDDNQNNNNK